MYRKNGLLIINKKSNFIKGKIDININKDKFNEAVISQDNLFNDIATNINGKIINNNSLNNLYGNTKLYTASNISNTYKYEIKINNNDVSNYLRINGVK
mgnify:FL=1